MNKPRAMCFLSPLLLVCAACGGDAFTSGGGDAQPDGVADVDGSVPADAHADVSMADAPDAPQATDATGDHAVSDAGHDAAPRTCGPEGGTFPTFDNSCTLLGGVNDCSTVFHRVDCCGTQRAIGINNAQVTNFQQTEALWEGACASCGCPPGPTIADDNSTGSSIKITCTNLHCVTHAQ